MVEVPHEVISLGTGIAAGVVSNLITSFLSGLVTTTGGIDKNHKSTSPSIHSYPNLKDFWEAYQNQKVREGDTIRIYGVFSDLGLTVPTFEPEKAICKVRNTLDELLHCFSEDSNKDLQKKIMKFDSQIDRLRLYLGSCIKLPPTHGFRYCNLFYEKDIIPVSGLPIFLRKNVTVPSPPFYGEVTGYVDAIPSFWKRILRVRGEEPVAIIVDNEAGGKLERQRDLMSPLYLSYWVALKYTDEGRNRDEDKGDDECIIATRGDYSHERNYKTCRRFLKTAADVEIRKLNAQLLFEYDQVNRVTEYQQILDQKDIDKILNTGL
ncbi:MAG: hypothetical protein WBA22_11710 [Candidatus Methanofastidiosia archaeon]